MCTSCGSPRELDRDHFRRILGDRLRSARLTSGLSQAGLAEKLGLSRPAIASIEAGRQAITVEQLVELCAQLNVNVADIIGEATEARPHGQEQLEKLPEGLREMILKLKDSKGRP
jgi:transcriptional regulator with XRE-family HTH domain